MLKIIFNTISTQIERHSRLERQGTVFGRTMVNFGEEMSKNYSIHRLKYAKYDHSAKTKMPTF